MITTALSTLAPGELYNPAFLALACFLCAALGWIGGCAWKHIACRNAEFRAWREAEHLFRTREEQTLRDDQPAPPLPDSIRRDFCQLTGESH